MNKHLIITVTLFLILGFQNCSNTASFDAADALVAKSEILPSDDGSNTYDGVIDEIADEMPVSSPPSSDDPPSSGGAVVVVPIPTPNDNGGDRDYEGDDDERENDEYASQATHVCVLRSDNPGKSIRLGKAADGLSANPGAVADICMSERACLEIVSKAFEVQGAESRGYCKHKNKSSNFVKMSDNEVEDAVANEMLKRIMSSN